MPKFKHKKVYPIFLNNKTRKLTLDKLNERDGNFNLVATLKDIEDKDDPVWQLLENKALIKIQEGIFEITKD